MKLISYMVPVLILLLSFFYNNNPFVVKEEAQQAFTLLNAVRSNPENYYKTLRLNAKLPIAKKPLRWNDTLAKVAESRALDMAHRNYFDHVDPDGYGVNYYIQKSGYKLDPAWVKNKADNFFESLTAGAADGNEAINNLIIDTDDPSFGHRNHLLGIEAWDASLTDIGIGFVKCDAGKYASYVCVIIAKHK